MAELLNEGQSPLPSTVIEHRDHADPSANEPNSPLAGKEHEEEKPSKPLSTRDAVAKAYDEAGKAAKEEGEDAKAKLKDEEKSQPKAKVEEEKPAAEKAGADEKPAKAEKPAADGQEQPEGDKRAKAEDKPFYEAPKRLLPKAKEAWANVPNVVKGEIHRIEREHEQEVSQYRESHEKWQKLAKFNDMAKSHNTTVADALERYTAVDALLHRNPIEGIRQVLQTVGITPQQYAQHVLANPDSHKAPPPPAAPDPVARQASTEVQQLRAEIEQMKLAQAAKEIIEPFAAEHPRYHELQEDIAFFLQSGKIPQSLSPHERLEAAYDMAERINPRSMSPEPPAPRVAPEPEPAVDPRGTKSIRGAPSAGFDPAQNGRARTRRGAVEAAMAEFGV